MAESCDITNTFNLTDADMSDVAYSLEEAIFTTIFMPIVTFIGVSSNLAFLFVLCLVKEMQNVTNFYLANLAIADMGYLITVTFSHMWRYFVLSPIERSERYNVPWKSSLGCHLVPIIIYTCYFASVFIIMLVSIERYFSVCHALRHRVMNSKKRATESVLGAWFLASVFTAFFMTPASVTPSCYELPDGYTDEPILVVTYQCIWSCVFCIATPVLIDIIQFVSALTITSVLYTFVAVKVANRKIGESNTSTRVKNAVIRMVIVTTLIFFVCSLPYQIINMQEVVAMLGGGRFISYESFNLLVGIGSVTSLLNAALNPIIYSMTNSNYRQAFVHAFSLKKK